jgi:outer membrane immunogenic protein
MWSLRVCAGLVASLAISQAFAADLRRAPVLKAPAYVAPVQAGWSGCYIGAHLGGAWSRQTAFTDPTIAAGLFQLPVDVALSRDTTAMGGGHIGCNWQVAPAIVLGVEGDVSAMRLRGEARALNQGPGGVVFPGEITFRRDNDWIATARGRVGLTMFPTAMLYATGGAAFTASNYNGRDVFNTGCPNCGIVSFSDTRTGWVVGGGVEWAIAANWSLRGEYLYHRFAGASATAFFQAAPAIPAAIFTFRDLEVHTARAGISYRFGS